MAVTQAQKVDFLLKKIGFTKTKTGLAVDETLSGTKKAGFAEAIPSPLIIANGALWNESGSIPATPPGSDTAQVKVYLAGTSGLRMTEDTTVSGSRAFIAYTTYNDSSTTRLTNWIDTQFGASYLIKVYKGDPNSGGVALSAAGSGANDGWFFDYSAGVLNFNDTNVPSGVTSSNIYIVGYRYVGQTGAPTSGISTFSHLDLTVERNLDVGIQGGISTFRNSIDLNADLDVDGHTNLDNVSIAGVVTATTINATTINATTFAGNGDFVELDVDGHTNLDNVSIVGVSTFTGNIDANGDLDVDGHTNLDNISVAGVSTFTGNANFSGNVSIAGTLTYEDVKNVDAVGLITARSGIRVTGGVIEAQAGENKVPALFANLGALPSPATYHGMFAHVHSTGRGYFSHAGGWYELVNVEGNGVVGTGTQRYNLGALVSTSTTATSLNVAGVTTHNDDVVFTGANTNARWDHSTSDLILFDNTRLEFGSNKDFEIFHGGAHTFMKNSGGDLRIRGDKILLKRADDSERYLEANVNNEVTLFFNGDAKFATTNTGVSVTGDAKVGTSQSAGVILTSPNGTEYRIVVADDGTLSTSSV